MPEPRYAIGDLADLGGVSRRTVRYYVQEGLLPSPFGLGRGEHYGPEHLARLQRIRQLQEAGRSLAEIKAELDGAVPPLEPQPQTPRVEREVWQRIALQPGVELHVAADVRLPSAARLQELSDWCRQHLVKDGRHS